MAKTHDVENDSPPKTVEVAPAPVPTVIQVMQPEALPPTKGLNESVPGGRFLLPVGDNLIAVNCNGEPLDGKALYQPTPQSD